MTHFLKSSPTSTKLHNFKCQKSKQPDFKIHNNTTAIKITLKLCNFCSMKINTLTLLMAKLVPLPNVNIKK